MPQWHLVNAVIPAKSHCCREEIAMPEPRHSGRRVAVIRIAEAGAGANIGAADGPKGRPLGAASQSTFLSGTPCNRVDSGFPRSSKRGHP